MVVRRREPEVEDLSAAEEAVWGETSHDAQSLAHPNAELPMVKAYFVGSEDLPLSNVLNDSSKENSIYKQTGALQPPVDLGQLALMFEISGSLRTNIDAYKTNIDGHGHDYTPVIDLDDDSSIEAVRQAMFQEQLFEVIRERGAENTSEKIIADLEAGGDSTGPGISDSEIVAGVEEITDEEAKEQIVELRHYMSLERSILDYFFDNCCPAQSFSRLRRITRQDLEIYGNAYWEVLRSSSGEPVQINRIPAGDVRLLPTLPSIVVKKRTVRSKFYYDTLGQHRSFRQFVQLPRNTRGSISIGDKVFFKEYGDPRVFSSRSNKPYDTVEALQAAEAGVQPASEVIHFKIESSRSPYGIPRWISEMVNILGVRNADQVNLAYFENKSVPPLAILISGGKLSGRSYNKLADYINNEMKGSRNFHKVMILEAEGGQMGIDNGTGHARVEIRPLTQQNEAIFLNYIDRIDERLGSTFQNPPIVRGKVKDFNKACNSEDTETLTENGWKTLEDFVPGERVAAYDPDTGLTEYVVPDTLHIYDVDEELVHFENQSLDMLVTDNHRMLVQSAQREKGAAPYEVHRADSVPWARARFKTTAEACTGPEFVEFALPKDPQCKIERGHKHRRADHVTGDVFVEFMGYWLSEGSLLSTDHPSAPYIVTVSQKAGPVADKMRACLDATGWAYSESLTEKDQHYRWTISNRCLVSWLRAECGVTSGDKRIPSVLRELNAHQSRILFDALMAGDGSWDSRDGRDSGYYPSTSKALADDVQALAIRLGYRANMGFSDDPRETIERPTRKRLWRVQLSRAGDTHFRGKPTLVPYKGKVYCFSVPSHGFFVTRRNGKVAIQGNTAQASIRFTETQVYGHAREDFDDFMNREILPGLGIRFWKFKSNGPDVTDPAEMVEMISKARSTGGLTFAETRTLLEGPFRRNFPVWDSWISNIPIGGLEIHMNNWKAGGVAGFENEQGAPKRVSGSGDVSVEANDAPADVDGGTIDADGDGVINE